MLREMRRLTTIKFSLQISLNTIFSRGIIVGAIIGQKLCERLVSELSHFKLTFRNYFEYLLATTTLMYTSFDHQTAFSANTK